MKCFCLISIVFYNKAFKQKGCCATEKIYAPVTAEHTVILVFMFMNVQSATDGTNMATILEDTLLNVQVRLMPVSKAMRFMNIKRGYHFMLNWVLSISYENS